MTQTEPLWGTLPKTPTTDAKIEIISILASSLRRHASYCGAALRLELIQTLSLIPVAYPKGFSGSSRTPLGFGRLD